MCVCVVKGFKLYQQIQKRTFLLPQQQTTNNNQKFIEKSQNPEQKSVLNKWSFAKVEERFQNDPFKDAFSSASERKNKKNEINDKV